MEQCSNSDKVMEAGDHFKNGASLKSRMSRRNFRVTQVFSKLSQVVAMVAMIAMCVVGSANAQTKPNVQQNNLTKTPLFIVDGKEWKGDVNSLSPESIKSITVLKDQPSIEQYGEKGKNGVIIITTKLEQAGNVDAPLIIVDGEEWVGGINSLSVENIESISVLKEASSVAQYGEKAKNGVVVITMKK